MLKHLVHYINNNNNNNNNNDNNNNKKKKKKKKKNKKKNKMNKNKNKNKKKNKKKKVLFTDGLCHIMWFLIGHIDEQSLLLPSISAFRKGQSTTNVLLGIRDDLIRSMKRWGHHDGQGRLFEGIHS